MPTKNQFNPAVDKDGKVNKTPLDNHLYLKKKARVVLVQNIDVSDGLNNGAKGEVLDFVKDNEGNVTQVIIKCDTMESGAKLRENQISSFQSKHPQGTPISKLHFYCSFSRKQAVEGQKALCVQFPLRLFNEKLKTELEEKYENPEVFSILLEEAYYNTTIEGKQSRRYLDIDKDGN